MDDLLNELEPQGPAPEERERRRRLIAAVGIAGLSLLTVGTLSSGAWFSDTETVNTGQIVTGSVILANQPSTVPFKVTNMAPGDTEYGSVTVKNTGSLQLRYSVTANTTAVTATSPGGSDPGSAAIAAAAAAATAAGKTWTPSGYNLADQLQFTVCDQPFSAGACLGTTLFAPGHWGDGLTTTTAPPADSVILFGSPTDQPVARTADRVIPAGGSDTLYIKAFLDGPTTGNEWQATGTAISLVFNSFQTANNTP